MLYEFVERGISAMYTSDDLIIPDVTGFGSEE